MDTEIFLLALVAVVFAGAIAIGWLALRLIVKDTKPPEEDEHATAVRPRDKHGRWVKEGDGLVVKHGPGTPWQRGRK